MLSAALQWLQLLRGRDPTAGVSVKLGSARVAAVLALCSACSVGGPGGACDGMGGCQTGLVCAPTMEGRQICWTACARTEAWICDPGLRCDAFVSWAPRFMLPDGMGICTPEGAGNEGDNCSTDDDCGAVFRCMRSAWDDGMRCRRRCTPTRQCAAGEVCESFLHTCHAPCDPLAPQPCSDFAACLNSVCVDVSDASTCQDSSFCALGQICTANVCTALSDVPPGTRSPGEACYVDWECTAPAGCQRSSTFMGLCRNRCGPDGCATSEVCRDGAFCEPP